MGISKQICNKKGKFSDLFDLPGYYPYIGYSDERFEREMVQPVVTNQEIPIVLSQKALGRPQLGHVLPCELGSYRIFPASSKLMGILNGI